MKKVFILLNASILFFGLAIESLIHPSTGLIEVVVFSVAVCLGTIGIGLDLASK